MLAYVDQTTQEAADTFYPGCAKAMTDFGRERGWPPMTHASFDAQGGADLAIVAAGVMGLARGRFASLLRLITCDEMLTHFLAALAYRTQKALRGAPPGFADFRAGHDVRTPAELVRHMASVLGYARTFFVGGQYRPEPLPDFDAEILRLHETIADLAAHLERGTPLREITPEQLLHGPFSDAMTHAGQLALLRRLAGSPVPPENFIYAEIRDGRFGPDQAAPNRPDTVWPEAPPGWKRS